MGGIVLGIWFCSISWTCLSYFLHLLRITLSNILFVPLNAVPSTSAASSSTTPAAAAARRGAHAAADAAVGGSDVSWLAAAGDAGVALLGAPLRCVHTAALLATVARLAREKGTPMEQLAQVEEQLAKGRQELEVAKQAQAADSMKQQADFEQRKAELEQTYNSARDQLLAEARAAESRVSSAGAR